MSEKENNLDLEYYKNALEAERKAHQQTRESLEEKEMFLDNITDIAYIADSHGNIKYVNPATQKITGLPPEDIINKSFLPLFVQEDHQSLMDVYRRTLNGEKLENILTFVNGQIYRFTSLPLKDHRGEIIGTFGIGANITEQKKYEDALKASESFFMQMFRQSKTSTQLFTPEGNCVMVNPEFCNLFGVSADIITDGRYNVFEDQAAIDSGVLPMVRQIVTDKKVNKWQINFDIALASESTDTQSSRKERVWIDVLGYPILNSDDDVEYFVLQHYDVSEQKRAENALVNARDEAEKANRSKSVFLSKMSHELRNTLNGIMLILQNLLKDRDSFNKFQNISLNNMMTSAWILLSYINNLLEIKRIEEGKLEIVKEKIHGGSLFNENLEVLSALAQEKGITVKSEFKNMPAFITTDRVKLNQVLTNLVTNAIKYTPDGGVIEVVIEFMETLKHGTGGKPHLQMKVTDPGIGIAEENLSLIFDQFTQIKDERTSDVSGIGLGLAISREIIQHLGGDIQAESMGLNQGSTFTVKIPVGVDERPASPPVADKKKVKLFHINILLAEDDAINAWALENTMKREGHTVTIAENGKTALEELSQGNFDIILMDMQMPEMSGEEAIKIIRDHEKGTEKHIPIIACTGKAYEDQIAEILHLGADAYVGKPLVVGELFEKMQQILSENNNGKPGEVNEL